LNLLPTGRQTRALTALVMAALLAACAQTSRRPSPAPQQPVPSPPPVTAPGQPVPRAEPRSSSGNPPFYEVGGHRYVVLASAAGYRERGVASWYGPDFHGLKTATGERYDMFAMTAAHKTLPIPCYARVTNLSNGRSVVVRINDRGPFVGNRIIDLSYSAARDLDMIRNGTAFVEVQTLLPAASGSGAELPVTTPAASAAGVGPSNVPPVAAPAPQTPADAPDATPASPPLAAPPTSGSVSITSHFYIQVGAYAQAENARRAAQKLRDAGLKNVLTLAPSVGEPLQRVRIGPIASVQEYDRMVARLSALGFPSARLAQD
jgi:rare lipoprotein A